jgi:hypothetical protein
LMSELTEAERTQLSNERLAGGQRLACQCRIEHGGEVMIKAVSATERSATAAETGRDLRSQFKSLPLERKIATLMQLETMAVTEVFDTFTDRSVAFGRKLFNFVLPHNNPAAQDKSSGQKKRP